MHKHILKKLVFLDLIKQKLSGLPLHKDHILSKVEGVVVPKPTHHVQQHLLVHVRKFNQHHPDVHL